MKINAGGRRLNENSEGRTAPNVTIVTVVYNSCETLRPTIDSVLALQRDDLAYIVVDGGSTDGTVEVLSAYGKQLDYWISEPDTGIYCAMNKAVRLASPDSYVLFLGAGDRIIRLPDAGTFTAARRAGTDLLFGNVQIGEWLFQSSFSSKLMFRNTLHHQGLLVRSGCPDHPWFNESLKVFADWDLNLALFKRGVSVERLGYTVAYAAPDGISAKLHLSEITRMIAKRSGRLQALGAFAYHGFLYLVRRYAGFSNSSCR